MESPSITERSKEKSEDFSRERERDRTGILVGASVKRGGEGKKCTRWGRKNHCYVKL